jgi:hypothetical protein
MDHCQKGRFIRVVRLQTSTALNIGLSQIVGVSTEMNCMMLNRASLTTQVVRTFVSVQIINPVQAEGER